MWTKSLIVIASLVIGLCSCGMGRHASDGNGANASSATDGPDGCLKDAGHGGGLPADAVVKRHPVTRNILSLKGDDLSAPLRQAGGYARLLQDRRFGDAAVCLLGYYAAAFQLARPPEEMAVADVQTDSLGFTHVRLRQAYAGIAVWPGEISVHFNASGAVYWVHGNYMATPADIDLKAAIPAAQAIDAAATSLGRSDTNGMTCANMPVIYIDRPERPRLAYRLSTSSGLTRGFDIFVDAHTGEVLKTISRVNSATTPTVSD